MSPSELTEWTNLMDTPAKRLAWALSHRKIESRAQAARLVGVPESTMRTYLLGTRIPPLEACEKIGAALRINPRWLHKGTGTPEMPRTDGPNPADSSGQTVFNAGRSVKVALTHPPRQLTLYSSALAGPLGEIVLSAEQAGLIDAPPGLETVEDAYAVHIVGDSMSPRYDAGEIVFVHPRKPVRRGDYVVVQLWHDEADEGGAVTGMVKRLVSISPVEIVLAQLNPAQEFSIPYKRVKSVHRIVGSAEG